MTIPIFRGDGIGARACQTGGDTHLEGMGEGIYRTCFPAAILFKTILSVALSGVGR
jgi:hypothetical protein